MDTNITADLKMEKDSIERCLRNCNIKIWIAVCVAFAAGVYTVTDTLLSVFCVENNILISSCYPIILYKFGILLGDELPVTPQWDIYSIIALVTGALYLIFGAVSLKWKRAGLLMAAIHHTLNLVPFLFLLLVGILDFELIYILLVLGLLILPICFLVALWNGVIAAFKREKIQLQNSII